MEEWKEYKLKDVTTILGDGLHGTPKYDENGSIFFINGNNLIDGKIEIRDSTKRVSENEANKYRKNLNSRTILVSINGTIGNVAKYRGEACILGKSACYFNVAEDFDLNFMYYVVASKQFKNAITHLATGTTIKNVSLETMRNYSFIAPSIYEQKRIANILSSLDDKIELNRRINENLEQQAQALFKSWFVDFEPFKDGKFVDSELGMIPEGWRVGTIGDYCKIRSGFAFKSSWWTERGVKIVKIKNISSSGILNMDDCSYVSKENVSKAKEFSLKSGDILIAMTGATIGKFCLVPALKEKIYVNQRVGKFFLGENPIMKIPFIHGLLKCENIISQIMNKGQGSAQPNISGNDIETIPIIYPPEDIILKYNELVSPYFSMIIENISACDFISQLRDTLLPRLMSGKLEIKDNSYD
ncbi:restriction endonuclease subunit S [Phocaeicola barnesiae]|uniref:Restriction endonuclease subunit S n=1 Tax=Phocaeicola barnesiae TaxID=376804 RepID=A0AAW5MWL4_9BACT|nr:restriction endonuclease subunit S [Phocaeicola barnesiae]MBS6469845.1 restriction endonuclease subunit S [Bacteroides sp.]MCR8872746.1 restriction endonuclease subunit S [Phocaeicola barnesiae]CDD33437.1 restriction modification system DNA specificity domain protein [Bacteroides sp. CAG:714]